MSGTLGCIKDARSATCTGTHLSKMPWASEDAHPDAHKSSHIKSVFASSVDPAEMQLSHSRHSSMVPQASEDARLDVCKLSHLKSLFVSLVDPLQ